MLSGLKRAKYLSEMASANGECKNNSMSSLSSDGSASRSFFLRRPGPRVSPFYQQHVAKCANEIQNQEHTSIKWTLRDMLDEGDGEKDDHDSKRNKQWKVFPGAAGRNSSPLPMDVDKSQKCTSKRKSGADCKNDVDVGFKRSNAKS